MVQHLTVGARLRDDSARGQGRTVTVTAVYDDCVRVVTESGWASRVPMARIFVDGRTRHYGYSLVSEQRKEAA